MSGFQVGVAGATGAVGKELMAVLEAAPWRPAKVVPIASARSEVHEVRWGDGGLPVEEIERVDLTNLDALVMALPAEPARELGERAIGDGLVVVDVSGAFLDDEDVPLVVPWVNPEALREPRRGTVAIPDGATLLLASVLGPLWRAGLAGEVDATVLAPASVAGRAGVDELSRQVVALFNSAAPPRKVFEHGLAFDVLPAIDELRPDGWTARELAVATGVARVLDGLGAPCRPTVTAVQVPVFSGLSATITITPSTPIPGVDALVSRLAEGGVVMPKVAGVRGLPRPRKVEGHPFAHVGRVRLDAHGRVHLWASIDNLRGVAAAAVGACGALLRARGN